ncbi:aldo/keto reductase [Pseudoalteromonas sp. S16_S37]|uniref:aldo/keto reductase n=1 Tax=Pseudoalteromonas sp. S16_S37 TaxID=2720228 RepID=UPI0016813890|nr:aldo/keto reductase [Pseudoalteromonas sp. S16_S37]MBD1583316.1 aldo/keto reductase [Pseudoalteromonas sp. S16_S37]
MLYTTLGNTGLRVSKLGLGCGRLGELDDVRSKQLVIGALERGVNFFDTADCYQAGESERKLGAALAFNRHQAVIATKFRHVKAYAGASRRSIRIAVEQSLQRLGTDYIDLYQLHSPDPTTPLEETIQTLQELVREGKILYFGLCNVKPWQLVDAYHLANQGLSNSLSSVQCQANVFNPTALDDMSDVLKKFKIGFLAASALGRGLLGGRYDNANPPNQGHPLLTHKGSFYWHEKGWSFSEKLRMMATLHNTSPANLAVGLLLANTCVSSALVGAGVVEQLQDTIGDGFFKVESEVVKWYQPQKALF